VISEPGPGLSEVPRAPPIFGKSVNPIPAGGWQIVLPIPNTNHQNSSDAIDGCCNREIIGLQSPRIYRFRRLCCLLRSPTLLYRANRMVKEKTKNLFNRKTFSRSVLQLDLAAELAQTQLMGLTVQWGQNFFEAVIKIIYKRYTKTIL
jgi:hypothetical protein